MRFFGWMAFLIGVVVLVAVAMFTIGAIAFTIVSGIWWLAPVALIIGIAIIVALGYFIQCTLDWLDA
jgi:hypothetical protein